MNASFFSAGRLCRIVTTIVSFVRLLEATRSGPGMRTMGSHRILVLVLVLVLVITVPLYRQHSC
jgi:uncharacterized membrane protein